MSYEYGWRDPKSGRTWTDGYQPIGPLVRVRRLIAKWEPVPDPPEEDQ